jgi:hypothetical protein
MKIVARLAAIFTAMPTLYLFMLFAMPKAAYTPICSTKAPLRRHLSMKQLHDGHMNMLSTGPVQVWCSAVNCVSEWAHREQRVHGADVVQHVVVPQHDAAEQHQKVEPPHHLAEPADAAEMVSWRIEKLLALSLGRA